MEKEKFARVYLCRTRMIHTHTRANIWWIRDEVQREWRAKGEERGLKKRGERKERRGNTKMEKEGGKVARRVGEREGWVEDRKWNEEAASLAGKINSGEPNPLALFRSPSLRLSLSPLPPSSSNPYHRLHFRGRTENPRAHEGREVRPSLNLVRPLPSSQVPSFLNLSRHEGSTLPDSCRKHMPEGEGKKLYAIEETLDSLVFSLSLSRAVLLISKCLFLKKSINILLLLDVYKLY